MKASCCAAVLQRERILVEGEPFSYLTAGPPDGSLVLLLHGFPDLPSTCNPIAEAPAGRGPRAVAPFMRG